MNLICQECYELNHIFPDWVLSLRVLGKAITNYGRLSLPEKVAVTSAPYSCVRRALGMFERDPVVTPIAEEAPQAAM